MNATVAIRMAGREVGATWPVLSTETWSGIGTPSRDVPVPPSSDTPVLTLMLGDSILDLDEFIRRALENVAE